MFLLICKLIYFKETVNSYITIYFIKQKFKFFKLLTLHIIYKFVITNILNIQDLDSPHTTKTSINKMTTRVTR